LSKELYASYIEPQWTPFF